MLVKRLKCGIAALIIIFSNSFLLAPTLVAAGPLKNDACTGLNTLDNPTSTSTACSNGGGASLSHILSVVINILSIVVGFAAVIMIIVAGLKFITANGDSSNVSTARNTILYAVIGLVIVAMAQILVHFVLQRTANAGQCQVKGKTSLQASDPRCK